MCTFFFRCLILTQKIAGFNSFARWLRKEQLTASAKCLCQSPKQPIPINIKSRTELLTCKCKMMGWWNLLLAEKGKHTTSSVLSDPGPRHWVEGGMYSRIRGDCRAVPSEQPPRFLSIWQDEGWSSKSHVRNLCFICLGGWSTTLFLAQLPVFSNETFHRREWY